MASIAQAHANGKVVGLESISDGQPQPRREIDDLMMNEPVVFNLFLLVLESIQKDQADNDGQQDKMSFFEIAGIHGLPNRPWNKLSVQKNMYTGEIGYCVHGSSLFPTWHRPYLAMIEQSIFDAMGKIAEKFKDPKYKDAVRKFRLPYWDYFHPRKIEGADPSKKPDYDFSLPLVLKKEELMVYRPEAENDLVPMRNPLRAFWFPKTGGVSEQDWTAKIQNQPVVRNASSYSRDRTVRYASRQSRDQDDYAELDKALNRARTFLLPYMISLVRSDVYKDYRNFATAAVGGSSNGSLEDFHGNLHVTIGGPGGHMSEVEVAAFDPIFWLHHCNIDRILAIWQALHEGFIDMSSKNPRERADGPLYPFLHPTNQDNQPYWDSTQSKSTTTFGYTYPDIMEKPGGKSIRERFDEKYGWGSPANVGQEIHFPEEMKPITVQGPNGAQVFHRVTAKVAHPTQEVKMAETRMMEQQVMSSPGAGPGQSGNPHGSAPVSSFPSGDELLKNEPEGTRLVLQWYVDCEVDKDAIDGVFTIFYFVGPLSELNNDPECCWQTEPNLAGLNHIFSARKENCYNCESQAEEGLKVTGTSPINASLQESIEAGKLQSLKPEDVEPFLKKNLIWRVVKADRTTEDPAQVPSLKVSVSATYSVLHPGNILPEFREGHYFPEITANHHSGNPPDQ
ncbi:hypothetical protein BFW01_g10215 [Lasiodiplodia theobromae]|uniref:tyrosinase n=1 Tax=Lasiodiplodia theobromae TaxID=45133 RepID=A0A8H7IPP2_9PEZI|nr:hypothetical protein BFW01_g10215 [Lasiodiplodia theobromae]